MPMIIQFSFEAMLNVVDVAKAFIDQQVTGLLGTITTATNE